VGVAKRFDREPKRLSIERVRQEAKFSNLSEQEVSALIQSIERLAAILFEYDKQLEHNKPTHYESP